MNNITKELHEALGYEVLNIGHRLDYHDKRGNLKYLPDYCEDPRLVIEAMQEREDFHEFVLKKIGLGETRNLVNELVDLIMDKTGKLAKLAIEWLGKQEGGK